MKLHPRLIASAARSRFGRFITSPEHTHASRALVDGPLYPARDFDNYTPVPAPLQSPPLAHLLLFWVIGTGLAIIYLIWFFSDLFTNIIR